MQMGALVLFPLTRSIGGDIPQSTELKKCKKVPITFVKCKKVPITFEHACSNVIGTFLQPMEKVARWVAKVA